MYLENITTKIYVSEKVALEWAMPKKLTLIHCNVTNVVLSFTLNHQNWFGLMTSRSIDWNLSFHVSLQFLSLWRLTTEITSIFVDYSELNNFWVFKLYSGWIVVKKYDTVDIMGIKWQYSNGMINHMCVCPHIILLFV